MVFPGEPDLLTCPSPSPETVLEFCRISDAGRPAETDIVISLNEQPKNHVLDQREEICRERSREAGEGERV
ncbi:MAG: hypothetical protein METHAR1v1_140004 [Methanothrix sp.]|nr:MAG: hypothetical protein METHAR1v1_140004 [Methanothrix sp.]